MNLKMKIPRASEFLRSRRVKLIQLAIPGWLSHDDSKLISLLLRFQHLHDASGDILEIGVYKGKLVPVFAANCSPSETIFLSDIFDSKISDKYNQIEVRNSYENTSVESVADLLAEFPKIKAKIVVGDSLHLESAIEGNTFRFIHVDGSHTYHVVKNDLKLALNHLDGTIGILSIDDYRTLHTPEVTRAVWELLNEGEARTILRSPAKIYLVKKESVICESDLLSYFREKSPELPLLSREDIEGLIVNPNYSRVYRRKLGERLLVKVFALIISNRKKTRKVLNNVAVIDNSK
jgi:hypothetical protein